jgi:ribose transport system substrate-binding protein
LLCAALAAGLFACSSGGKTQRIAVIPKGTTHEFWKSIHAGAMKAAQEFGVEIIWKGPLKEDNREAQIAVVENFVTQGVTGIVLAPLDDKALVPAVEQAVQSKVPVVIIDSDIQSDKYVSFVATDNYVGGKKGAERLAALLEGKGKVILLRYAEGSASTEQREKGFLDEIAKTPGIEIVSSNQYGGATTESAMQASENLLEKVKQGVWKVDGIFCPNESTTFGMLRALQEAKLAGKVKFVGFDASEKLVQALRSGEINGLVLQDPVRMGYEGVRTMVRRLRGEQVDKRIDTGAFMVTPENMDQAEMQELLNPPLDKYLK